jgi:hypothetical protein
MSDPTPVSPPWYENSTELAYIGTTVVTLVGGIFTLLDKPFNTDAANAIVTSVAFLIAGAAQAVFTHVKTKLLLQKRQNAHEMAILDRTGR